MKVVLGGIFIFNDPSDSDFADWLSNALKQSGYPVARSLEESEVVLFIVTSAALKSPWLDSLKKQLHERRERGDLEITLGAILRSEFHYTAGGRSDGVYDFVVDFSRNDQEAALQELRRKIEGQPEGWLIERPPSGTAMLPNEAGVLHVHLRFPLDTYVDWIRQAQQRIKVLITWSALMDYSQELLDAVRRGVNVQFLLLEPDSPIAGQRAQDIFHFGETSALTDENEVSTFIRESVRRFNDLYADAEELQGTFELRLFSTLPSFPIHISDNLAFVGFYPHAVRGTNFPHLEIRLDSPFGEQVAGEFERIWTNARPHKLPTPSETAREANEKLLEPLTAAELLVLGLVCKGLTNQEIADQLVVQRATVRAHKNHIYSKLGINSVPTLLVVRAQELGLC